MHDRTNSWHALWMFTASMFLGAFACAPRNYAFDNSVNSTCRTYPVQCAGLASSEAARARLQAEATASAGASLAAAVKALDELTRDRIVEALTECANEARSEVLERHLGDRNPTPEDCREVVGQERGQPITRAMQFGEEMHQLASECARKKLSELIPGRFSLEQRYRYDKQTGQVKVVTREEEEALLRQGLSRELLGTLKPDVVIHTGNPLQAQAVYDFKFPCVNKDGSTNGTWRTYPDGHPYDGSTQKEMYQQVLRVTARQVWRILPRWGALP